MGLGMKGCIVHGDLRLRCPWAGPAKVAGTSHLLDVEPVPASWPLWARIAYRAGPHCAGTRVKDGSCDLGLARESPETSPWCHGLWLVQPSARASPLPPELAHQGHALCHHSCLCHTESRAVLVPLFRLHLMPCRPACPASCGLLSSPWVGYGTFQCSLDSSPMAGAEDCQFDHPWPEPPPLRGFRPLRGLC